MFQSFEPDGATQSCRPPSSESLIVRPSWDFADRRREPPPAPLIHTPEALKLRHAPIADCARYDQLATKRSLISISRLLLYMHIKTPSGAEWLGRFKCKFSDGA
jgi:hypothetical protein